MNGLYGAATSINAAQKNVSQNLANANVSGYRRQAASFEQALGQAMSPKGAQGLTGTRPAKEYTGNPLDAAVQGDNFFVLQGPNGPLYTRNGIFQLNAQGQLESNNGLPVSGIGGPITIPANAKQITIAANGTVLADNKAVGQLQLAHFADANALVPAGTNVFEAPKGVQPQTGTDKVLQGYRE
jgi:flagellar basal-body rod protein FlgF